MAEPTKELSLQELQCWALKFFPKEFNCLPPLEAIKFESFPCTSRHDQPERMCIHVASDGEHPIRVYVRKNCTLTYSQTIAGEFRSHIGGPNKLYEPFSFVHSPACPYTCPCEGGPHGELRVVLLYYSALKGFNKTIRAPFLLAKFRNACESIAARRKQKPEMGIWGPYLKCLKSLERRSERQFETLFPPSVKSANGSNNNLSHQVANSEGENLQHIHGNDADGAAHSDQFQQSQPKSSIPQSKPTAQSSMLASPPSTLYSSTMIVRKLSPSFSDDFGASSWTGECAQYNIEPSLKRPASTVKLAKGKDGAGTETTKRRKTAKPDAEQQRTQRDIHAAGTSPGKEDDIKTEISAEADFLSIEMGIESQNHDNHSAVLASATQYARDRKDNLTEKEAATQEWEARCKSLEARLAKSERRADKAIELKREHKNSRDMAKCSTNKAILLKREYKKSRDMARRNAKAFEDRLANTEARFAEYKRSTEHKLAKASELYHRYKKIVELASTKDPIEEEFGDLVVGRQN